MRATRKVIASYAVSDPDTHKIASLRTGIQDCAQELMLLGWTREEVAGEFDQVANDVAAGYFDA